MSLASTRRFRHSSVITVVVYQTLSSGNYVCRPASSELVVLKRTLAECDWMDNSKKERVLLFRWVQVVLLGKRKYATTLVRRTDVCLFAEVKRLLRD